MSCSSCMFCGNRYPCFRMTCGTTSLPELSLWCHPHDKFARLPTLMTLRSWLLSLRCVTLAHCGLARGSSSSVQFAGHVGVRNSGADYHPNATRTLIRSALLPVAVTPWLRKKRFNSEVGNYSILPREPSLSHYLLCSVKWIHKKFTKSLSYKIDIVGLCWFECRFSSFTFVCLQFKILFFVLFVLYVASGLGHGSWETPGGSFADLSAVTFWNCVNIDPLDSHDSSMVEHEANIISTNK